MYKQTSIFLSALLWGGVAGAQVIVASGFGQELGNITWQSWAWTLAFASVGIMTRVDRAKRAKEIEMDTFGVISWVLVGVGAALVAFALCEYINSKTGHRMYDWLEGGIIALAAYNRDGAMDWFSEKLKRFADGWAATNGAK